MAVRDGILNHNTNNPPPLYLHFVINLGPVRIVSDINGQPNIIEDGMNVAQRIMNFAHANQILVSRSYYEVTSRLTLEFSRIFDYSGIKHHKHAREHEVYSVRANTGDGSSLSQPLMFKGGAQALKPSKSSSKINSKYAVSGLFVFGALFGFVKLVAQTTPTLVFKQVANTRNLLNSNDAIKTKLIPSTNIKSSRLAKPVALTTQASLTSDLAAQQTISIDKLIQGKSVKSKLLVNKVRPKVTKVKTDDLAIPKTLAKRTEAFKSF